MEITSGIINKPQKIVVYGPEGIGKSTFASKFPDPLFDDTEGSTNKLDVRRTPRSTSWTMLFSHAQEVRDKPSLCKTFVLDTADWAEQLGKIHVCSKSQKDGIEDFGYGKGYTYLAEAFGKLLNLLQEVVDAGVNVVITAHATMRKFEQPDEMGSYDRWEMKLEKKVYPLVKEWADMVLFCNYKTTVINVDNQGAQKGKNKVQGGKRVIYTSHHPCWDAKNRHDLEPELPFDYEQIRHCIETGAEPSPVQSEPVKAEPAHLRLQLESKNDTPPLLNPGSSTEKNLVGTPKPLADLMAANGVTVAEIQLAVASRGYYPVDTPVENYDPNFISGVLVGAWPQVFGMIEKIREEAPF
jgi:GTPase SAR1 family protein